MEAGRDAPERRNKQMKHYTQYQLKFLDGENLNTLINLYAHDDGGDGDGGDNGNNGNNGDDGKGDKGGDNGDKGGDKGNTTRTYTDADVDAIIAKKFAKWQKDHEADLEKAKEEARKYERMTKEQKAEADKKKAAEEAARKDARIKELENQIATDTLRKTVAADVEGRKEGITPSQDFLDLVVLSSNAEETKKNVEKLVKLILDDRKQQEKIRARGNTPKNFGGSNGGESAYDKIVAKYNR